ncbi:OmpA/MotB family protein [Vampirovibrio chlorellavorus]|uniref:OmpA/MotB family protein n=1 Tax=Vampirovibrio chlorellavorus TaxID=758823 RepID=UPI0026F0C636|nr:OmpA family protein [Vampirovibrio chlorellavorus]
MTHIGTRRNQPDSSTVSIAQAVPVRALFRKLETLEREMEANVHTGHNRWMVPYADLLTLLLGLFLVLVTAAKSEPLPQTPTPKSVASVTATQKQLKSAQNLPKKRMADSDALSAQLKQRLHMQGVEIRQQERGVVISLKDNILFAPGSADLSPTARHTLHQLISQLKKTLGPQARLIRVEGHSDNTPITTSRYPSNWELSTARATNIVRYLIEGKHYRPEQLSATGYGEFKPVAQNSSIEGKQKNRRVDIVVLNESMALQEPPAATQNLSGAGGISPSRED